jgi:hypothetical protein
MSKTMAAKFAGKCSLCGRAFDVGAAIAWEPGYTAHIDCHSNEAAAQAAEDKARHVAELEWRAAFKRGELAKVEMTDNCIKIRQAPSYEYAKDLAYSIIQNASLATGKRMLLKVRRVGGKRYIGRELTFGSNGGTCMAHHDGWAFDLV